MTTRFKDLAIGQTFDFINDAEPRHTSFFDRCLKVSARKYSYGTGRVDASVGTVEVEVFHVGPEPEQPGAPNLDDLEADDCFAFWAKHQEGRSARDLFPAQPSGFKRTTADLANYASNIGAAKGCRARGDIQGAQMYETIAQRIYDALPAFARW